jgi:HK97 family phage portal protein
VEAYVHRVGDRETTLDPADVIHFRLPDPANDLWGLSPLSVAARQIDTDSEASRFVDGFFRNAAVPFGIIKLKRTLRGGEAEARRIGQRWTDRFRGLFGRFQVGVLDADAEFQRIGLTQDEMAFPDLRAQTEARICAAFRVPPILVGVKVGLDRATFANMAEARRFFWENTLLGIYRRIESKLETALSPEYERPGEDLQVRFDFADVAALRPSRESVERSALAAVRAGVLSVDDARRCFGLAPLPAEEGARPARRALPPGPEGPAHHHAAPPLALEIPERTPCA